MFVAPAQVTSLYNVSYPPKVLKRVFHIWLFVIYQVFGKGETLASNYRCQ